MVAFHFMQSCEMYMCQETKKEKKKKSKKQRVTTNSTMVLPYAERKLIFY